MNLFVLFTSHCLKHVTILQNDDKVIIGINAKTLIGAKLTT